MNDGDETDPARLDYANPSHLKPPDNRNARFVYAAACFAIGIPTFTLGIVALPLDRDMVALGFAAVGSALCFAGMRLQPSTASVSRGNARSFRTWRIAVYLTPVVLILAAAAMPDRSRTGSHEVTLREIVIETAWFWIIGILIWLFVRAVRHLKGGLH